MNKNYVIGANKAIVIDKDKLEAKDYTDNFEEILEQENIIEIIKNKLEKNENNRKKLNERLKRKRTENALDIALLVAAIIVLFVLRLLLNDILTNSLFVGKLITQIGVFILAFITGKIVGEIKVQVELKKIIKGIETELELLNEKLPTEKQKLEDLRKVSKHIETTKKIEYKSVNLSNVYNLEKELKELKIKKRIRERK